MDEKRFSRYAVTTPKGDEVVYHVRDGDPDLKLPGNFEEGFDMKPYRDELVRMLRAFQKSSEKQTGLLVMTK